MVEESAAADSCCINLGEWQKTLAVSATYPDYLSLLRSFTSLITSSATLRGQGV